jgi:hypothetical protein
MNKGFVAVNKLLISDEELTKPVEPRMGNLNDPTAVFRGTASPALLSRDPRGISIGPDGFLGRLTVISLIRIQEAFFPIRKRDNNCVQHCSELADIMTIRSGNDQGQRDAMGVHQQMPLASLFSPCLSGSVRLLHVREVL